MLLISAFIASLLVVLGQSLWKTSLVNLGTTPGTLLTVFKKLITSPHFLLGSLVYGVAVVAYLYLLQKYKFSQAQTVFIVLSLVLSNFAATVVFGDKLTTHQYLGLSTIIAGLLIFMGGKIS
jgi:multidrug transporter EmrE-like cation transporter